MPHPGREEIHHPNHELVPPQAVHYRPSLAAVCCEECVFFIRDGASCERVYGPVYSNMLCDLFTDERTPVVDDLLPPHRTLDRAITPRIQKDAVAVSYAPNRPLTDDTATRYVSSGTMPRVSGLNSANTAYTDPEIQKDLLFKDKHYISSPANAPAGVSVQHGPRGGLFYDTGHGGDHANAMGNTPTGLQDDDPAQHETSAMIAWFPTSGQAQQLARTDGEKPDDLHVTIVYLGRGLSHDQLEIVNTVLADHMLEQAPMTGEISGIGRFGKEKESGRTPLVALVDVPGLSRFQAKLVDDLEKHGIYPPQDHGFTPHLTVAYEVDGQSLLQSPIPTYETTPISISRLFLVVGDDKLREYSFDAGVGQVSPVAPAQVAQQLQNSDDDALTYARFFRSQFIRGVGDPRYSLALIKAEGSSKRILELE